MRSLLAATCKLAMTGMDTDTDTGGGGDGDGDALRERGAAALSFDDLFEGRSIRDVDQVGSQHNSI